MNKCVSVLVVTNQHTQHAFTVDRRRTRGTVRRSAVGQSQCHERARIETARRKFRVGGGGRDRLGTRRPGANL